jgi:hypothetical protein
VLFFFSPCFANVFLTFVCFIPLLLSWMGYTVAFTNVLIVYQIYHTWLHLLHTILLYPPPPIPEIVSRGLIFAFTYMCVHSFCTIFTLLWPPAGSVPPSCSPILQKKREMIKSKAWHFLPVWDKSSYTRSFLVLFL